MKVNTHDNEGDLSVVQSTTSASRIIGSAQTGSVLRRRMCVTAKRTVTTEVTSYPRTAPKSNRFIELCRSVLLLNLKLFISEYIRFSN